MRVRGASIALAQALAAGAALWITLAPAWRQRPGHPAPALVMPLLGGGQLSLAQQRGHVVLTYNYYRGSVVTPFHGGPTSPSKHHWTLSQGELKADGAVHFHAYVDAGTPAEPSNVLRASLISDGGQIVEEWDGMLLAHTPKQAFKNDFAYQKIHAGKFGLVGPVGAQAMVELAPTQPDLNLAPGHYTLHLVSVNGHLWSLPLTR